MLQQSGSRGKAVVYAGFAATGLALTQVGALMPVLLRRWHMDDARGGVLLFCFFVASSLGALISRGRMNRSVARGAALTALGSVWLAFADGLTAFGAVALYGLGLGVAMTSVSLLQWRLLPGERRIEMTRLNLVWAIGASFGPWLALGVWSGTRGRPAAESPGSNLADAAAAGPAAMQHAHAVFLGLAVFFAVFAVSMQWFGPVDGEAVRGSTPVQGTQPRARWGVLEIPWPLLVLVFCATGVEASAGGWLTTFAQRNADNLGTTIGAATCLWAGLLAGRVLHSTRSAARLSETLVLGSSTVAVTASLVLLIAWPTGAATIVAAATMGFAIGPVYPLLLALALRRREQGAIFVIAGAGSSLLPLATGAVSGWTHSLRSGLGVPLVGSVVMVAVAWLWTRTAAGERAAGDAEASSA